MPDAQTLLFALFGLIIIVFLAVDLGFFNKKAHVISPKSALRQTFFWIAISLGFAGLVYALQGAVPASEFLGAYVTEKMLSVDNLFVILLIFNYFKLEEKYYHKVLFWGILGAIVLRGIAIGLGAFVISQFHFVLYIFGALLVYTGFKLLFEKKEEHQNIGKSLIYRIAARLIPVSKQPHEGRFTVTEQGKRMFTSLLLIVALVEMSDLVFAIDSIPAAFSISQSNFIVYTSNIFAIMGLRAMFFLLESVIHKFHHLQKGLSIVLLFIGGKMLIEIFGIHISSGISLAVIMLAFGISIALSLLFPKKF